MTLLIDTILTQAPKVTLLATLAKPNLIRRKASGRYTMRLRKVGSTAPIVSIGLKTTVRSLAMSRLNELSATAKAFLLDNPEATAEELRKHLKWMAECFLTDATNDYWDGVEVAHLHDAKANLREIAATQALSVDQQKHIREAIKLIAAAQQRVNKGDAGPLLDILDGSKAIDVSRADSDAPVSILEGKQGGSPSEFTREHQKGSEATSEPLYWDELSSAYREEHKVNQTERNQKDLLSTHKAVGRFAAGINFRAYTRPEVSAIRDAMIAANLAPSTVNKLLTRLSTIIAWACRNGHIQDDYTKGLKLKNIESTRRAFSEDELGKVVTTIHEETNAAKRFFGLLAVITGARCGELTQLTKADIYEDGDNGLLCIDINANNGKALKNKASARVVPLIDGAFGFRSEEFREYVASLPDEENSSVFRMSRDVASKWFNEVILPKAIENRSSDLVLHSLRHTMATLLKHAGVAESTAQDVLGHTNQSITFNLYGKTKSVNLMAEALKQALPEPAGLQHARV
ncbi:tyrosine-type recombinase/integrase [Erwinia sp. PK3-005]